MLLDVKIKFVGLRKLYFTTACAPVYLVRTRQGRRVDFEFNSKRFEKITHLSWNTYYFVNTSLSNTYVCSFMD